MIASRKLTLRLFLQQMHKAHLSYRHHYNTLKISSLKDTRWLLRGTHICNSRYKQIFMLLLYCNHARTLGILSRYTKAASTASFHICMIWNYVYGTIFMESGKMTWSIYSYLTNAVLALFTEGIRIKTFFSKFKSKYLNNL